MQPFTVELFVDALILVLHCKDLVSRQLANDLISLYEKTIQNNSMLDSEYLALYASLIKQVIDTDISVDNQSTTESFLLKFKSNPAIVKDPEIYTTLKKIFSDTQPIAENTLEYYQNELRASLMLSNALDHVKHMYGKLATPCISNESRFKLIGDVNTLCNDLTQANMAMLEAARGENKTIAREVDFSNSESIKHGLEVYEKLHDRNVLTLGLQGMNRALDSPGLHLGESMVINTLAFNGKSMSLLKIARWITTLTKLDEDFKRPLCIFYSLENETPQNLMQMFNELWVNEFHEVPPENVDGDKKVEYLSQKFQAKGWTFVMKREVGADFGVAELESDVNNYIKDGYTPLAVIVDYVNLMKKPEDISRDLAVRYLYNTLCNFLKAMNCCFITAHQLNREAAKTVLMNPIGAVKRFNESMLSDSQDVQREVDIVFYQHKEIDQHGRAWMTWKMSKHRYHNDTPEKVKYFAYMFEGPLGILDDINGPYAGTDNIYAAAIEDESEDDDTPLAFS